MIDLSIFSGAIELLFSWQILAYLVMGAIFGMFCGAMPGLTAVGAIAILLPITFMMTPINAIVFLCAIYVSAITGGSITAILINTPGTPASTCTSLDGFQLTKQGKAAEALGVALAGSALGGMISYVILLFFMLPLAKFALKFGPSEMFMVAVFGLSIVASLQGGNFNKGLLSCLVGIMLGTIGIGSTGTMRGCFSISYLIDGVPFVPTMMGLFAVASLFELITSQYVANSNDDGKKNMIVEIFKNMKYPFKHLVSLVRGSVIGTIIGAIPAAGGSLASFISYNEEKRYSRTPEKFGTGEKKGILASESANNASTGGALLTMLAIGIPGDAATGLMMGALMMHGLRPGPRLFIDQGEFVYGVIIALFVSQIIMLMVGLLYSAGISKVTSIRTSILVPVIAVICVVGSYSVRYAMFDAWLMLFFGVVGYYMKKHEYPALALVLGLLLGPIADAELSKAYILFRGDLTVLFTRPINIILLALTIFSIVFSMRKRNILDATKE